MNAAVRLAVFAVVVTLWFAVDFSSSFARKEAVEVRIAEPESSAPKGSPKQAPGTQLITELILGEWDFESPPGQGWTTFDRTLQPGNYTHVDDFQGMGPDYTPINGQRSLWCGRRAGDCTYASLPGYGNRWNQRFESLPLPVTSGDVLVDFRIRYDTEAFYDPVTLEYQALAGTWTSIAEFSGVGSTLVTATVPEGDIGGTVRLRFRFVSDGVYSDEDGLYPSNGAYILDDIFVYDDGGVIDSQNFEDEAPGDQTTFDGDWSATVTPGYGMHAALMSGASVLQEDPVVTNTTNLWGFFQGSTYNYACGGHPEQLVVPYARNVEGETLYLDNEIWSPAFRIDEDVNGLPVSGPISLQFDVYRDLAQNALVFYRFGVRSLVGACWGPWRTNNIYYYGPSKSWFEATFAVSPLIDPGATEIQVAIGAVDACSFWCGIFGDGTCHSQGPLIDNVKVFAAPGSDILTVTNTNDSGAGSLRLAIDTANAMLAFTGIVFDIPGAGPHVIAPTTPLPVITTRVTIDGYTQPGASANTDVQWKGSNAVIQVELQGSPSVADGLVILADQCVIRGLAIHNFTGNGIYVQGNQNRVEGCFIGLRADGMAPGSNQDGIQVAAKDNVVGGVSTAARNVIAGNTNSAIWLASEGTAVLNNFIGTSASGLLPRANRYGIVVNDGNQRIIGNLISGNTVGIGIWTDVPDGTMILGNRIGTDVTGADAVGNTTHGIEVHPSALAGGVIGIGSQTLPNVIAHNGGAGIDILLPAGPNPPLSRIGYNEIHSNAKGVVVNHSSGIFEVGAATLTANAIHDNVGVGIDLNDDDVTANDAGDVDLGANGSQNFPDVSSVTNLAGGGVTINGSLSSLASQPFAIEFFASPACDATGFGEGALYLGTVSGATDGSGVYNFSFDYPAGIPGGWYVTTTATRTNIGSTSEFSTCGPYVNTPMGSSVAVVPVDVASGESPIGLTFANVTGAGNTSLTIADTGPPPPGGLLFGDDPKFYDLSTTATFTGTIEVCIQYDETTLTGPEANLQVLHYDETLMPPAWVNVTSSIDTDANILCGVTTSLSPFAIAEPEPGTAVGDAPLPAAFALHPCAPNPFNPATTIRYDVPTGGAKVSIAIFDVTGRRVRTLVDGPQPAGQRLVTWDGRDQGGRGVASGVYFYRMSAGAFTQTRKMVLLK